MERGEIWDQKTPPKVQLDALLFRVIAIELSPRHASRLFDVPI